MVQRGESPWPGMRHRVRQSRSWNAAHRSVVVDNVHTERESNMNKDGMQDAAKDMQDKAREKAREALPDDDTVEEASEKLQGYTPDAADTSVAKAEQWAKDRNKD